MRSFWLPARSCAASPPDTTTALIVRKELDQVAQGPRRQAHRGQRDQLFGLAAHGGGAGEARGRPQQGALRRNTVPTDEYPLLAGQIDAIGQVEPFRAALMATGQAEIVSWPYVETAPNTDITQYIALTPWVEKNRATVAKFVRAVIKGAKFAASNEAVDARRQSAIHQSQSGARRIRCCCRGSAPRVNLEELNHTMDDDAKIRASEKAGRCFQPRLQAP